MAIRRTQHAIPGRLVLTTYSEVRGRAGLPHREPVRGKAFVPDPLPPSRLNRDLFVGRLHSDVEEALTALLRLEGALGALPNPQVLLRALRKREIQRSSTIENTIATIEEIARVEAGMPSPRAEAVEVHNNLLAMEAALVSPLPLCNRLLREAHWVLLSGARGGERRIGSFRDTQAYIGDEARGFAKARFVPAPPGEHLERCMRDLEVFLNPQAMRGQHRFPWLIELGMAHYQFEAIHPFSDGNGRLGRLLVNIAPCKWEKLRYPIVNISEYFVERRQVYYDGLLRVSTRGDWENWIRLFCRAASSQAAADLLRTSFLAALRDRYFALFTRAKTSIKTHELIDLLFMRPLVRVADVARYLGVTAPTAQSHIDKLVGAGIVREVTGRSAFRVYQAHDVLRAIDAPLEELRD